MWEVTCGLLTEREGDHCLYSVSLVFLHVYSMAQEGMQRAHGIWESSLLCSLHCEMTKRLEGSDV